MKDKTATDTSVKKRSSPSWFGGIDTNYQIDSKLNLNINSYFSAGRTEIRSTPLGRDTAELSPTFILNTTFTYEFASLWQLSASGRNLLDTNDTEYFGTDRVRRTFWLSLAYGSQ